MTYDNVYEAGKNGEGVQIKLNDSTKIKKSYVDITVYASYDGKTWKYAVSGDEGQLLPKTVGKKPTEIPKGNKTIYGEILKEIRKEHKDENLDALMEGFKAIEDDINSKIANNHEQAVKRVKRERRQARRGGKAVYDRFKEKNVDVPRYLASISRWLVAGEEANVIKILLAIMNTAKGEATNIISESASASGKTHIEKASFSLVHDHHHVTINHSTTASFKNLALEDPYMFQNKVVRLGDLGTEKNQEAIEELMGILKILNSEGMYESNKMAKDGETQIHIKLYGRTAMCYSKVANTLGISDQDISRGIFYAPNPLNDVDFEEFAMWKNTPDYVRNYKDLVDEYVNEIRDYMEYLIASDVEVVNPYQKQISEILKKNKAYRRILTKELWLLKSITLLNLPKKQIHEIDGRQIIYVSVEDVMNYMTLYKPDIIANSNYDMDVHSYRLWEMVSKDYEGIAEDEVMATLDHELGKTGTQFFDDHKFQISNRFFTINKLLGQYRGTHQLNNIISEVKDHQGKVRRVLQNMMGFIGYTTIPNENFQGGGAKPTLYYVCKKAQINNLIDKLVLDKETLYLVDHMGMGKLIPEIINDFKTVSGYGEAKHKGNRIIIAFSEHDCKVMDQHPDIQIPPTNYISSETRQRVDEIWEKSFPEPEHYEEVEE